MGSVKRVLDAVGDCSCDSVVACVYVCVSFVTCLRCSLYGNSLGDGGGAAIGAGLRHLSLLTVLEYVRSVGHAEEASRDGEAV